jgi:parallel beta-helix repeat protein
MMQKILITGIVGALLFSVFTVFYPVEICKAVDVTISVDDNYNTSTLGWNLSHFDKIQNAINAANTNDTVYVYNGTYYEHIVIKKTINLIGEDKNNTIIDGSGHSTIVQISANRVNISRFTIRNGGRIWGDVGIDIESNNSIISGNTITDTYFAIYLRYSSNNNISNNYITRSDYGLCGRFKCNSNTISENIITNNTESGIYLYRLSKNNIISKNFINNNEYIGIYLSESTNSNIISENIITNNNYDGICFYQSSNSNIITENNITDNGERGIYLLHDASDNFIDNNTITNNKNGINLFGSANSNTISRNTITNNNIGINISADSYDNQISKNIYSNNIKDIQNYSRTPGFELVLAICAIALILFWKRHQ